MGTGPGCRRLGQTAAGADQARTRKWVLVHGIYWDTLVDYRTYIDYRGGIKDPQPK